MGDAETYRKRAQECAGLAASSAQPEHRLIWLELEHHWLRLAETAEIRESQPPITTVIVTGCGHQAPEPGSSRDEAGGPISAGMKVKMVARTTARESNSS